MRHKNVVIDTTPSLIPFPHFTMQAKKSSSGTSAKSQAVLIHNSITVPPMITKTITAFVDPFSEWNTAGTVTPVERLTEAALLIRCHSISTKIDRKIAVRLTNTKELPYATNKNTQIADFSVVSWEQSKFVKPVDTSILNMIPEGDPDMTIYWTELLRTNNSDQQNNTFWFPTPENPGNAEGHTPIQIRILEELRELQLKAKLNPIDDAESEMNFLERFDWTDTMLTQTEKQTVENFLIDSNH